MLVSTGRRFAVLALGALTQEEYTMVPDLGIEPSRIREAVETSSENRIVEGRRMIYPESGYVAQRETKPGSWTDLPMARYANVEDARKRAEGAQQRNPDAKFRVVKRHVEIIEKIEEILV